jgi:cytochrome P450
MHRAEHGAYGDTFSRFVLGGTSIHTRDPRNVQAVLSAQFRDFEFGPFRRVAMSPLLGDGIFTADGSRWLHARRLLKPNLTRDQLAGFLPRLEMHVEHLMASIQEQESLDLDLQPLLFRLTMDSTADFLFGRSTCGESLSADLTESVEIAQEGIITRARLGPFRDILVGRRFFHACEHVRSVVGRYVELAAKDKSTADPAPYTFLRGLMDAGVSSHRELCDHAVNMIIAGRDTTAGLISLAVFVLARRPDLWDQLQAEIVPLDGRPPNSQQLRDLSFLSCVLKEVLRLYSPTPMIGRSARNDTTLPVGGGLDGTRPIFVPRGTFVMLSLHAMHQREDIFGPNAHDFHPQRWANSAFRPGWGFLPFSGGPRVCIGRAYYRSSPPLSSVCTMPMFTLPC